MTGTSSYIRPSWSSGFASPVTSLWPFARYPSLWKGCIGAWCPALGWSGNRLLNHARLLYGGLRYAEVNSFTLSTDCVVDKNYPALQFDNTNNYVDCGPIEWGGTASTIAVWFNQQSNVGGTVDDTMLSNYNSAATIAKYDIRYIGNSIGSSKIQCFWGSTGSTYTWANQTNGTAPSANTRHHVCWTRKSQTLADNQLYLDGIRYVSMGFSSGPNTIPTTGHGRTSIGRNGDLTGGAYSGLIYDVMLWDRALEDSEVAILSRRPAIQYEVNWDYAMRVMAAAPSGNPWYQKLQEHLAAGAL